MEIACNGSASSDNFTTEEEIDTSGGEYKNDESSETQNESSDERSHLQNSQDISMENSNMARGKRRKNKSESGSRRRQKITKLKRNQLRDSAEDDEADTPTKTNESYSGARQRSSASGNRAGASARGASGGARDRSGTEQSDIQRPGASQMEPGEERDHLSLPLYQRAIKILQQINSAQNQIDKLTNYISRKHQIETRQRRGPSRAAEDI